MGDSGVPKTARLEGGRSSEEQGGDMSASATTLPDKRESSIKESNSGEEARTASPPTGVPTPSRNSNINNGQAPTSDSSVGAGAGGGFFMRNGLSDAGDSMLCDDIAQSLFPSYERRECRWQGWCSYSVVLTPPQPRERSTAPPTTTTAPNPNIEETAAAASAAAAKAKRLGGGEKSSGKISGREEEVARKGEGALLLQFRTLRHAIDVRAADAAAAVYGGFAPRVVEAGTVGLWPRAIPPARELLAYVPRSNGSATTTAAAASNHHHRNSDFSNFSSGGGGGDGGVPVFGSGAPAEGSEGVGESEDSSTAAAAAADDGNGNGNNGFKMLGGRGGGGGGGLGGGSEAVELQLEICAMTLLPGVPYGACQTLTPRLNDAQAARQRRLVMGFAEFMARGWLSAQATLARTTTTTATTTTTTATVASLPLPGPASLHAQTPQKLAQLAHALPDPLLRGAAARVRTRYLELGLDRLPAEQGGQGRAERRQQQQPPLLLPLTLNHGDVVPGNIMVSDDDDDEEEEAVGGALTGLVDWAEAEVGVWGLPLYGLEFLLGFVSSGSSAPSSSPSSSHGGSAGAEDDSSGRVAWGADLQGRGECSSNSSRRVKKKKAYSFTYYEQAASLRELFWEELERRMGRPLRSEGGSGRADAVGEAVRVIRDVGVLLWFGFAWDEGRIDRVVNERDDPRELVLLEAFLRAGLRGKVADHKRAKL